jgi:hypothetical protein
MKKLLIFLLSVQLLAAQDLIQRGIFEVCYSTQKKTALVVGVLAGVLRWWFYP